MASKRGFEELGDGAAPLVDQQAAKVPRTHLLGEDRVAGVGSGSNIIEGEDGKRCTHEVAWPPNQEGSLLPPIRRPGQPAREYAFKIDPFQQSAINALEAGHSVLVAAHTSAGKTVVAEYAFAMALRDKARVVYTSPLKALSNQKFREFSDEFGDVGLMTGDVTINPTASCLVMTTEILRSMLYRGSEVVREVGLIVYDEIHYLRDKERGVVWEESIILAPKSARFAFLSATIPNAKEFAEWVAKVHGSPCHVVYTDFRPTPLQHYIFPTGGDGLFMVVDEKGTFRDDNFQKAVAQLNDLDAAGGKKDKKSNNQKEEKTDTYKIVKMLMQRNYDPVIVFSFSKKECEKRALEMNMLDLTDDDEKKLIESIYTSAMDSLSLEDQKLPQIQHALPMLKRGVGVHHAGLLPILKEAVEVLFGEGLLRVLFATETFSTGLNMPARTVVFTNVRKFDGGSSRWVTSGEYIQMSGRAGRRGIDDRGIVILMLDTKIEPAIAREMIKGAPDAMNSAFHLQYSMILNLMRVEGANPAALVQQSFRQFQAERSLPKLEARVLELQQQRDAAEVEDHDQVLGYQVLLGQLAAANAELRNVLHSPHALVPFLNPGRLVCMLPKLPDPKNPVPDFEQVPSLQPADGAGPEEAASSGAVGAVCPGIWGAIVDFQRIGKKGGDGAGGPIVGDDSEESDDGTREPTSGKADSEYKSSSKHKKKDKHTKEKKRKHGKHDRAEADQLKASLGVLAPPTGAHKWLVDVLVNAEQGWSGHSAGTTSDGRPRLPLQSARQQPGSPHVVTFPLSHIDKLSSVRIYLERDLRPIEARQKSCRAVGEALGRLITSYGRVPLLDPKEDMKVALDSKALRKLLARVETLEDQLRSHPLVKMPTLRELLVALQQRQALEQAVQAAQREATAAAGLVFKDELRCRQRVLRRLGCLTDEGVVTRKGQLTAQLQTSDELVLCEMVLGGAFNTLNLEQVAAVCSCFVWREKSMADPKLREDLLRPLGTLKDAARRVARVQQDSKLPDTPDPEDYADSFRPDLMEPVAQWVRGVRFKDMVGLTTIYEGSLVRAVRRLEELLRQMHEAVSSIGEEQLAMKFEDTRVRLKRDIVFAASLYL